MGDHRPNDSTSCAVTVRQRNLFDGNTCWMSLLELLGTIEKVDKIFHGHFLIESKVIEKVKSQSGCSRLWIPLGEGGSGCRYIDGGNVDASKELLVHDMIG